MANRTSQRRRARQIRAALKHYVGGRRAGDDNRLLGESGHDRLDQLLAHARRWAFAIVVGLRRPAWVMPVGPPQRDRISRTAGGLILDPMAFEGGVDAGEQAADAVAESGGFAGQVVEADQHLQLGQCFVADVDRAQGVGQERAASAMTNASRASVLARPDLAGR